MGILSLPVRERGLKCEIYKFAPAGGLVAPRAGAWIEMSPSFEDYIILKSLPVRERGLKCLELWEKAMLAASLPVRERGLKFSARTM